jgi:uncharacterized membrane protein YhaH (DUF805 family)
VDWVWFMFGFDGRINRAKMWLAMLVIVGWMIAIALLMVIIGHLFGNPVESIEFNIDDIFGFVDPAVLHATLARLREGKEASPAHLVLMFFQTVGSLLFVWVYLAALIKRLHDRDKGGWWIIPYFVFPGLYSQFQDRLPDSYLIFPLPLGAILLMIAGFVEIYFLKGTPSTNRFGRDPLAPIEAPIDTRPGWDQGSELEFVPRSASPPAGTHVNRGK